MAMAAAIGAGMLGGMGAYTFHYAKGTSYLSNDPRACANCHVMQEHYDSWVKSSHSAAATCNDCHVPHGFPAKYFSKFRNGWNHSKAFTFQDFPDPIRIKRGNLEILEANCIHCHDILASGMLVHEGRLDRAASGRLNLPARPTRPGRYGEGGRCTSCHRSVGHMTA
jgi:cytochrome c nitrite reductase small subunit